MWSGTQSDEGGQHEPGLCLTAEPFIGSVVDVRLWRDWMDGSVTSVLTTADGWMVLCFSQNSRRLRSKTKKWPQVGTKTNVLMIKKMQQLQPNISAQLEVIGGGVMAWCGCCYTISTSLVSENNHWAQHWVCVSLGQPVFPCLVSNDGHPLLSFTSQGSQSRVAWWLTSLQLMTMTQPLCVCVTGVSSAQNVQHHGAATWAELRSVDTSRSRSTPANSIKPDQCDMVTSAENNDLEGLFQQNVNYLMLLKYVLKFSLLR